MLSKDSLAETIDLIAHVIRWATMVQEELSKGQTPVDLQHIIIDVVNKNAGKNQGEVVKATTEYLLALGYNVPPHRVYSQIREMIAAGKLAGQRGAKNALFLSVV